MRHFIGSQDLLNSFTKLFSVPVPSALLPVFDVKDAMREKHKLHTLNTELNVILGVLTDSRLLKRGWTGCTEEEEQ